MRKTLLFLAILLVSLTSCSSDVNDTTTNPSSNKRIAGVNQSVSDVLEEKDYDTQKTMYLMLSPEDQLSLWQYKIDNLISDYDLTPDQAMFIKSFKD